MFLVMTGGCDTSGTADLVFVGGKVWTGADRDEGAATAVAVADGRIVAVGGDEQIRALSGSATRVVDLGGRRLMPAFIDSHVHFIEGGFDLASVQLRDAATPEEFARRIGGFARENPGEWVRGGTWDHELWGGELPSRDWVDSLTPDTPVFVTRLDGHMSLANSKAMELAGVDASTPDPRGGLIERFQDGRPAGVFKDAAQGLIFGAMPARSDAERDRALQVATARALSRGVALVTDMGSWRSLETYRRAADAGRLPLRVYSIVPIATWSRMADFVRENGRGDARLAWGGVKGFVDGSLGSTTAWFYEPYDDEPDQSGFMIVDDEDRFRESILSADSAGLHVIVHAIGDRANDWLLDVYADAVAAHGPRDRRFRIEHAQHLRPAAVARFAAQGVIPSMQPYHAIDDGRWAEKRIGPERIAMTYAFRSLLDAGANLTFGSDWTVAPISPLLGIYAATTRRTIDGLNPNGWVPGERITVQEAAVAYTRANAYASFLEDRLGTIEVGKLADIVVLSDDIFTIDPVEIESSQVDMTMVGGEVAFERDP